MSVETNVDGRVAVVTLDRPDSRNALSDDFLQELVDVLVRLDRGRAVDCIVVAGQLEFFSAGADLRELYERTPIEVFLGRRAELWRAVREVRVPLVAAVSGHCLGGGCELALSCDLIVAARSARFGQPETGLGLIPGGGGSQRLTRLVGPALAADMILTGRRLTAEEAQAFGMVARVCEDSDCLAQARALAAEVVARPRIAQMLAKQALSAAVELPFSAGVAFERAAYQIALASGDARRGLAAFLAGEQPAWEGN
jgi:enoyl-CoA hydratase